MSRPQNRGGNNIEIVIESQDEQSYSVAYTEEASEDDEDQYTESNQLVTEVSEDSPQETELYEEESSAEAEEEQAEEEQTEGQAEGSSLYDEESEDGSSEGQDEIQIEIEGDFDQHADNNINLTIELPQGFYMHGREGQVLNINIERMHNGQSDDEYTEEQIEIDDESQASQSEGEDYSESEQPQEVMVRVHNQPVKPLSALKPLPAHKEDPPKTKENAHKFCECSICFHSFHREIHNSCYLECLHWFHFDCLSKWATLKQECPVCRKAFDTILKLK